MHYVQRREPEVKLAHHSAWCHNGSSSWGNPPSQSHLKLSEAGSPNQDVYWNTLSPTLQYFLVNFLNPRYSILPPRSVVANHIQDHRMSAGGIFSSSSALFSSPEFLALDDADLLPFDAPGLDQLDQLPSFADLRNSFIVSLLTSLVQWAHHRQPIFLENYFAKIGQQWLTDRQLPWRT